MMAQRLSCPNPECCATLGVGEDAIGRRTRCPKCSAVLSFSASIEGQGIEAHVEALPRTSPSGESQAIPTLKIGRYQIRRKLGSGAFGTVYRAYDPMMDRDVALKVPREGVLESPTAIERFLQETRAAAKLRHPHIIPAYDAGVDGGRYFIASAFVEGKTLDAAIPEGGIDPKRAARIVRELADGLHHAHELGIIHRDVKPSNVMLDRDDRPNLMDFGLARIPREGQGITQTGFILGTPAYLAPEQATGRGPAADALSDQYSLGATLFHLLTGQPPFVGPLEVILFATVHQAVPPPSTLRAELDPALEAICIKATAKQPGDRFASCRVLVDELDRWMAGTTVSNQKVESPTIAETLAELLDDAIIHETELSNRRGTRQATSFPMLWIGVGVIAALVVAAVVVAIARRPTRPVSHDAVDVAVVEPSIPEARDPIPKSTPNPTTIPPTVPITPAKPIVVENEPPKIPPPTYGSLIRKANGHWIKGEYDQAIDSLDRCEIASRGWEWNYLHRVNSARLGGTSVRDLTGSPMTVATNVEISSRSLILKHDFPVDRIAIRPDGGELLVTSGPSVWVWNLGEDWGHRKIKTAFANGLQVGYGEAGKSLVTVGRGAGPAEVFNPATGARLRILDRPFKQATALAVDPQRGRVAVAVGEAEPGGRCIRLFDGGRSKAPLFELKQMNGEVNDLAFSPDGRLLCSGDSSGKILIFDAETGQVIRGISENLKSIERVRFSPDSLRVAVVVASEVQVRDALTGSLIHTLTRQDRPRSVTFSGDGRRIATGSEEGTLRVWDAQSGEKLFTMTQHEGPITDLGLSLDGRWLVTAGADSTVRVWDSTGPDPIEADGFFPLYSQGNPILQGWKMAGPGAFIPESGGVLKTEGGPGALTYTRSKFDDFTFRVDFLLEGEQGDSGIYIKMAKIPDSYDSALKLGYEIQLYEKKELNGRTGSLYTFTPTFTLDGADVKSKLQPPGIWNNLEITSKGLDLWIRVNGDLINSVRIARRGGGYIGLQNSNSQTPVRFRNIRVKRL